MTSEVEKSESLRKFLAEKGLREKFDLEVKKRNPKSFQKKNTTALLARSASWKLKTAAGSGNR